MNPKAIGEVTEGIILSAILKKGFSVSIPFGNNQRYDLIVDDGNRLYKIQCKTGWLDRGCLTFATSSKNGFTHKRQTYVNQIDAFMVYCKENDKIYLIPIDRVKSTNQMCLRLEELKSTAPKTTSHWAKDFEF